MGDDDVVEWLVSAPETSEADFDNHGGNGRGELTTKTEIERAEAGIVMVNNFEPPGGPELGFAAPANQKWGRVRGVRCSCPTGTSLKALR